VRHGRILLCLLAALLAILASGFSAGPSLAQDGTELPLPIRPEPEEEAEEELPEIEPQEGARPIARASRIETMEAPTIDGDISDLAWAKSTVIDDIRQRQPDPGAPATERTVVRVMYDANNLYFSVYAYDSVPDEVVVRSRARDGQILTGDNIQIILDPGQTRRNSYLFMMGPSGGRYDALRLNNVEELPQWDTLWEGRAMRVPDGWVAEIAIPFRNLSYEPGQTEWGFEFTRYIRRKAEIVRWSSTNPAIELNDVSEAGTLTGITAVTPGVGLDVQPYVALRTQHDWSLPDDGAGLSGTGGGNIFYRLTPALTGTLTFNPDFSDAPLDERQVNTTRFSLFFPETREFFLQDAGNFEFGGRGFRRTNFDRQSSNGRPFFSRNLGLVEGQPVTLIAGGKLSGEYGGFNIGALSVLTDETPTSPGQVLSVARVTHPVFSQSRVGFIFTNGDPTGVTRNTLAGLDFNYRDTETIPGKTLQADLYYERSFSNTFGDDDSYGVALNYPNEPWSGEFTYKVVGQNFYPALGFVNRNGVTLYDGTVAYLARFRGPDAFLRTFEIQTRGQFVTDLSNRLLDSEIRIGPRIFTAADNDFQVHLVQSYERIDVPFTLPTGVVVLAGAYEWTNFAWHMSTNQGRPVQVHFDFNCCSLYDGQGIRPRIDFYYRPNEVFELELNYEPNFIRLPTGNVDIHVGAITGIVNFTPDMQLVMQAQYDNISGNFGFLGRYRWEFRPGTELLVALGQTAYIPGTGLPPAGTSAEFQATQLSIRLMHTFLF
jgi:hypothetical protein